MLARLLRDYHLLDENKVCSRVLYTRQIAPNWMKKKKDCCRVRRTKRLKYLHQREQYVRNFNLIGLLRS